MQDSGCYHCLCHSGLRTGPLRAASVRKRLASAEMCLSRGGANLSKIWGCFPHHSCRDSRHSGVKQNPSAASRRWICIREAEVGLAAQRSSRSAPSPRRAHPVLGGWKRWKHWKDQPGPAWTARALALPVPAGQGEEGGVASVNTARCPVKIASKKGTEEKRARNAQKG